MTHLTKLLEKSRELREAKAAKCSCSCSLEIPLDLCNVTRAKTAYVAQTLETAQAKDSIIELLMGCLEEISKERCVWLTDIIEPGMTHEYRMTEPAMKAFECLTRAEAIAKKAVEEK